LRGSLKKKKEGVDGEGKKAGVKGRRGKRSLEGGETKFLGEDGSKLSGQKKVLIEKAYKRPNLVRRKKNLLMGGGGGGTNAREGGGESSNFGKWGHPCLREKVSDPMGTLCSPRGSNPQGEKLTRRPVKGKKGGGGIKLRGYERKGRLVSVQSGSEWIVAGTLFVKGGKAPEHQERKKSWNTHPGKEDDRLS